MIRCCIFDLGGTIVDKYSLSPLLSLSNAFGLRRIMIPSNILSKDMGKMKLDHIKLLCNEPVVKDKYPDLDPIDVYRDFNKFQINYMDNYLDIIPETKQCIKYLDDKSIRTGITTGFNKEQMDIAIEKLRLDGIILESAVSSSCIPNASRPNPDMINENMDRLNIRSPKHVIKIDDTEVGIQEGINAGCYTVGVAKWSINMNVYTYAIKHLLNSSNSDVESMLYYKLEESRKKLKDAGADYVIDTLDELPKVIDSI